MMSNIVSIKVLKIYTQFIQNGSLYSTLNLKKSSNLQTKMEIEHKSDLITLDEAKFICLRPYCPYPCHNFMSAESQHVKEVESQGNQFLCEGWTLNIENLKNSQAISPNVVPYYTQPMKSLLYFQKVNFTSKKNKNQESQFFEDFQSNKQKNQNIVRLRSYFETIREKVQEDLKKTYQQIEKNITYIENLHSKVKEEVQEIISIKDQTERSQRIFNSQILREYAHFTKQSGELTILNEGRALKQLQIIQKSVKNLQNCFWSPRLESKNRQEAVIKESNSRFKQFENRILMNSQVAPPIKVQEIANLFKAKTIQPQMSSDKSIISVKCWICGKICSNEGKSIKERKNLSYQALLDHILQQHRKQIKVNMMKDSLNYVRHKITFKEFLEEIEMVRYEKFVIIDRENINRTNALDLFHNDTYCLSVVSEQVENIAGGRYMTTQSTGKDSADNMIVIVIHAITQSGFFNSKRHAKSQIYLSSKDHFGDNLKEILKEIYGIDIIIIS